MAADLAFVIGYDISDPRRLLRVHREMCRHATPLEYSIFLLVGRATAKDRCLQEIDALIKPQEDDVRCYACRRAAFRAASAAPACRRESCGPGCRRQSPDSVKQDSPPSGRATRRVSGSLDNASRDAIPVRSVAFAPGSSAVWAAARSGPPQNPGV